MSLHYAFGYTPILYETTKKGLRDFHISDELRHAFESDPPIRCLIDRAKMQVLLRSERRNEVDELPLRPTI